MTSVSLLGPSLIADDGSVCSFEIVTNTILDVGSTDCGIDDDLCFESSNHFNTPAFVDASPAFEMATTSQTLTARMVSEYDLEDAATSKQKGSSTTPYDILKNQIQQKHKDLEPAAISPLQHKISIVDVKTSISANLSKPAQANTTIGSFFAKSPFPIDVEIHNRCEEASISSVGEDDDDEGEEDLNSLGFGTEDFDDFEVQDDMFDAPPQRAPLVDAVPSSVFRFSHKDLLTSTTRALVASASESVRTTIADKKRPAEMFQVASVFGTPSAFFQKAVTDIPSPNKKQRLAPVSTVLHKACQQGFSPDIIHALLDQDPKAAGQAAALDKTITSYDIKSAKMVERSAKEMYSYPVNLALAHGADDATIHRLVKAAPQVMTLSDGPALDTPLHVLIRSQPNNIDLVDSFLLNHPGLCKRKDRRGNLPLHTACQAGASETAIQHLCILYPEALEIRNMDGMTPVQISQRNGACSEAVVNLLWSKLQEQY